MSLATTLPTSMATRKVTSEVVNATPEIVRGWLESNMRNRNEKPNKQALYAKDMINGKWLLTGEAIKFDWNDEMIDGQNRCKAHLAAAEVILGLTLPYLVVRGLDPEVRAVIDTGVARTAADGIQVIDGHANAVNLAALAKLAIAWDKGFTWLSNYKPTHTEIRDYINAGDNLVELTEAVRAGRSVARLVPGPTTFWAFSFLVCYRANPDDFSHQGAHDFFDAVASGEQLRRDDPRLVLRNRITRDAQIRGTSADFEKRALTFRAWNAWRDGDVITKLQGPRGIGWNHKNFPRPY